MPSVEDRADPPEGLAPHGDDGLDRLASALLQRLAAVPPVAIVGVTGSVAVGKSVLAHELAGRFDAAGRRTIVVEGDGFLFPNDLLTARGLFARKGYRESYDWTAFASALERLRHGERVDVPRYDHGIYDIDGTVAVQPEDIVIVEGLHLTEMAGSLDVCVWIDAEELALERWYVERFQRLTAEARRSGQGFYRRFAGLDDAAVEELARAVWHGVNRPILLEELLPARERADVIVRKASDHRIEFNG